jgi:tetratricopeptide (TPR) repeat protein
MIETQCTSHQNIQDLFTRREFKKAEEILKTHIQIAPTHADTYYLLAVNYYLQNQIGPALENLKKTLSIDPKHTDAAICLSVLCNDIGKYDDAKLAFEQANQSVTLKQSTGDRDIDKKFSVKHLELADLYFRYQRFDESIEEYSKAARLDPTTLDIRIRRAKAYAKKGFFTRSMQELQQLKVEQPHFTPARIQLGLLHYSQGNILDAELEWEGVIHLDAQNREALTYLNMAKKARLKGNN